MRRTRIESQRQTLQPVSHQRDLVEERRANHELQMRLPVSVGDEVRHVGVLTTVGPEHDFVRTCGTGDDRAVAELNEGRRGRTDDRHGERARELATRQLLLRGAILDRFAERHHPRLDDVARQRINRSSPV